MPAVTQVKTFRQWPPANTAVLRAAVSAARATVDSSRLHLQDPLLQSVSSPTLSQHEREERG